MNCHLAVFIAGKLFDNSFVATGVVVNRNSLSHSNCRSGSSAPVEALISSVFWFNDYGIVATDIIDTGSVRCSRCQEQRRDTG